MLINSSTLLDKRNKIILFINIFYTKMNQLQFTQPNIETLLNLT